MEGTYWSSREAAGYGRRPKGKSVKRNVILAVFHIGNVYPVAAHMQNPATLRRIMAVAEALVRAGQWGQVATLRLAPTVAASLIREGILTEPHFAASREVDRAIHMVLALHLRGRSVDVKVRVEMYGDTRIPAPGFMFVDRRDQPVTT